MERQEPKQSNKQWVDALRGYFTHCCLLLCEKSWILVEHPSFDDVPIHIKTHFISLNLCILTGFSLRVTIYKQQIFRVFAVGSTIILHVVSIVVVIHHFPYEAVTDPGFCTSYFTLILHFSILLCGGRWSRKDFIIF